MKKIFKVLMVALIACGVGNIASKEKGLIAKYQEIIGGWANAAIHQPRKIINRIKIRLTSNNFAQVFPGLYRSAQLSEEELKEAVDAHRIATIINLRKLEESGGKESVEMERAFAQKYGLRFIHIPLDGKKMLPPDAVAQLLEAYANHALRPILVHCKAGADRTGAVVALFTLEQGESLEHALAQQEYGHIDLAFPRMKEFTNAWYTCHQKAKEAYSRDVNMHQKIAYYRTWYKEHHE